MTDTRNQVLERSDGRCEAMVRVKQTWTRCGKRPVEVHHMLKRSRGGLLLDQAGEIYHLIALCPGHHRMVDEPTVAGLVIDGYAHLKNGQIVYTGTDTYLAEKYSETE